VDLAEVFGWNLPFRAGAIPEHLVSLGRAAGILRPSGGGWRASLSVASLGELLFLHSPIPARGADHVFFGPDSYRFAGFIDAQLPVLPPRARILDLGCGAGVGGLVAARKTARARLTLSDINPAALRLARINAAFAGRSPAVVACDGPPSAPIAFDLVVANPPYISGSGYSYSDGGGALGGAATLDWTRMALKALAPGGSLLMYSGSAIVRGVDHLRLGLHSTAEQFGARISYAEIDPDVFPLTLLNRQYWGVERIAAIGAVLAKPG
jgi:SAM-dependent methyltransferase